MKTWLFLCDSCWQARIVKRNRHATKTVEFPEKKSNHGSHQEYDQHYRRKNQGAQ